MAPSKSSSKAQKSPSSPSPSSQPSQAKPSSETASLPVNAESSKPSKTSPSSTATMTSPFHTLLPESRLAILILLYSFIAPYTKVEESFNMQAVHDLLAYGLRPSPSWSAWLAEHYDHVAFPGAVPRTFVGAIALAAATKPVVLLFSLLSSLFSAAGGSAAAASSSSSFSTATAAAALQQTPRAAFEAYANAGSGESTQLAVRAVLGLWNAGCLIAYSRGVRRAFGRHVAEAWLALAACQFHLIYYASRLLPNFLALGPVVLALRDLLPLPPPSVPTNNKSADKAANPNNKAQTSGNAQQEKATNAAAAAAAAAGRYQRALTILTVTGIVFRSELAVLLASHTITLFAQGKLNLRRIAAAGTLGLLIGLGLTLPIDSFFWQQPHRQDTPAAHPYGNVPLLRSLVWPELEAFVFNVIQGRAEDWGRSPVYAYFVPSLPKLLFNPVTWVVCIPVALLRRRGGRAGDGGIFSSVAGRCWTILLPNLLYVAVLSLQAHKEWRFVVYVLPPLTTVAAVGADALWRTDDDDDDTEEKKKIDNGGSNSSSSKSASSPPSSTSSLRRKIFLAATLLSIPVSTLAGFGFLIISSLNYPGAAALNRFHLISSSSDPGGRVVAVHMDTLSCMTGITRFLEAPSPVSRATTTGPSSDSAGPLDIKWTYDKEEDEQTLLDAVFWEKFDYVITESPERAIGPWQIVPRLGTVTGFSGIAFTRTEEELQRQHRNADLAGEPSGRMSDMGRNLLMVWNDVGLSLLETTGGRWITARMEPKLYILRRSRGAL